MKCQFAELACQFLVFVSDRWIVRLRSQSSVLLSCSQTAFEECVHAATPKQFCSNGKCVRSVPFNKWLGSNEVP